MSTSPYKNIHIVINPASGKDEPVLNVLNDVFHQYEDIEWTISVSKKYGDATTQAREAAEGGMGYTINAPYWCCCVKLNQSNLKVNRRLSCSKN